MYNNDLSSFDVSDNIVIIISSLQSFRILTFTFTRCTMCIHYYY